MMSRQLYFPITESSQVAEVRRAVNTLARLLSYSETEVGQIAIVAMELATNILKHAERGQILVREIGAGAPAGLELLALDQGPGIANIGECLRDGYSTAGSPGNGMGAIKRLATNFDLYSKPGAGTAVLAQFHLPQPPSSGTVQSSRFTVGAVCLPKAGEQACGDDWGIEFFAGCAVLLVADGLGHGTDAAIASQAAVRVLGQPARPPAELLNAAHGALRGTRGAAIGVAELDPVKQQIIFTGVGNIAGAMVQSRTVRHFVSHSGIVGHEVRRVQEFTYPYPADALIIMHSDGLTTHWNLDAYPGLSARHPSLIAGVLYRDFTRGRDDVTVVVVRHSAA